jgi:hypothetical protein
MVDQTPVNDPFDTAEDPQEIKYSNEYFGEAGVDAFFCVLEKGHGKVPFDPNYHSIDRRLTAVVIGIIPVPASGLNFSVDRDYIAEFRDWNAITLPSLKKLGISLRDLDGRYVHAKLTETGETYTTKAGETKEKTVFEFLEVFDTLEACEAAYEAKFGSRDTVRGATRPEDVPGLGGSSSLGQTSAANSGGNGGMGKETALKFLTVAVQNACRGKTDLGEARDAVAAQIAKMPMISKHFTVDSPETMNLMAEAMAA